MKIIECVPNFSEGTDIKIIEKIAKSISAIPKIKILDINKDKDHNRSVITFIGPPENVIEAAFEATKTAKVLINLNNHKGEHPRIGATDVIPLIPIKNITYKECASYAKKLAKRIGTELKIPTYLYEKATNDKTRKNLANIRKGEFETLKETIKTDPQKTPDFGPKKLSTAGATAIGVRGFLIAFNINLKSQNIKIAKSIANKIREKNKGLKNVKAIGINLKSQKKTQVSMNLTNYKKTPPLKVFKKIQLLSKKHKIEISESELIGLAPTKSMPKNPKKTLKIKDLRPHQIVDILRSMNDNTLRSWVGFE